MPDDVLPRMCWRCPRCDTAYPSVEAASVCRDEDDQADRDARRR